MAIYHHLQGCPQLQCYSFLLDYLHACITFSFAQHYHYQLKFDNINCFFQQLRQDLNSGPPRQIIAKHLLSNMLLKLQKNCTYLRLKILNLQGRVCGCDRCTESKLRRLGFRNWIIDDSKSDSTDNYCKFSWNNRLLFSGGHPISVQLCCRKLCSNSGTNNLRSNVQVNERTIWTDASFARKQVGKVF